MNFEDVEERDGAQCAAQFLTRDSLNNHPTQALGYHGMLGRHPESRRREQLCRLQRSTRRLSSATTSHLWRMNQ